MAKKDDYIMKKVASFILFVVFRIRRRKREGTNKTDFFSHKNMFKSLLFSIKSKSFQAIFLSLFFFLYCKKLCFC